MPVADVLARDEEAAAHAAADGAVNRAAALLTKGETMMTWRMARALYRPHPYLTRRVPLYHPDFPFILLWSQKGGCTTVLNWFLDQVGLLEEARRYRRWVHFYEMHVYKRRPGYMREMKRAVASGRHRVVKVVRHPFHRAASGYLVLGAPPSARPTHWAAGYWRQAGDWLAERGLDAADGLSFEQHLDHLTDRVRERFDAVNLHVAQQYVPGEERVVREIVPIERFAEWATAEASRLSLRMSDFEDLSRLRHHRRSDAERTALLGERPEAYRMRRAEFSDHRFPDGKVLVNQRTLAALTKTCAADIAAYGHLYDLPQAGDRREAPDARLT